jgi:hypothetical protein
MIIFFVQLTITSHLITNIQHSFFSPDETTKNPISFFALQLQHCYLKENTPCL